MCTVGTQTGTVAPQLRKAEQLTQQLLVLLLDEAALDTQPRVGKVLAHVVLDLFPPYALLPLVQKLLDAFPSGIGRVRAHEVLLLAVLALRGINSPKVRAAVAPAEPGIPMGRDVDRLDAAAAAAEVMEELVVVLGLAASFLLSVLGSVLT